MCTLTLFYVQLQIGSLLSLCRIVADNVFEMVDYWITFNEPHIFCLLTYCAGAWPGGHPDMLEAATSTLPTGVFQQAMHWMAIAHTKAYDYIHGKRFTLKELFSFWIKFHISQLQHFDSSICQLV